MNKIWEVMEREAQEDSRHYKKDGTKEMYEKGYEEGYSEAMRKIFNIIKNAD